MMKNVDVSESALSRRVSELIGVGLFFVALIWLIALVTYEPTDPVWLFTTGSDDHMPANFIGRVGAFIAEVSFQLLGYSAYILPIALGMKGWHYFWCLAVEAPYSKAIGTGLLLTCGSAFLGLAFGNADSDGSSFTAGGYLGTWVAQQMATYFNQTGSILLIVTLGMLAVLLTTQVSFGRTFGGAAQGSRDLGARGVGQLRGWWDEWRKARAQRAIIARQAEKANDSKPSRRMAPQAGTDETQAAKPRVTAPAEREKGAAPSTPVVRPRTPPPVDPVLPLLEEKATSRRAGSFTLPPASLLDPAKGEHKIDERELTESAQQLEEKCREFAVDGQVTQIHPGPVVTTFEFKPEAGVKYSKITSLADDLCLAMQAESVLIDRIPGKATVGIQIPNPNREAISLRELLESDAYKRSASKLTLALGKTIHGEPYVTDLAAMPHLLIAGSTGTGKSVGLNAMLTSILFRATPDDVRLIMIDPKRLELGMYENIPHLLTPVVVDPKKASNALRWAVREMEERYKLLAAEGVRNIDQYNRNMRRLVEEGQEHGPETPKPIPFILVVIDELADLMMVAGKEVEESIVRLAQMARAVGIHLILATQRPSVDVITGLIKANMPARVSFRVSSKTDSRTILDGNGAEQLLGKGDMLYLPPASSRCVRLHGAYISEQESARLASFLRKQGEPTFDEAITAEDEKAATGGPELEKDELYDQAARIVVDAGQVSISYLQRKMRIGFSRAARLVDMMEAEGLVSAGSGGKPREVLVDRHYFEEVDAQLR